jgi:exodeoxyribonuclease VIII
MKDVMVDIETFSTGRDAVIASVGAVRFDLDTGEIGEGFYMNIDTETQEELGFNKDPATIQWWSEQCQEARDALLSPAPVHINVFAEAFAMFCKKGKGCNLWGNGSNFDNRVLREAYTLLEVKCPWHYRNDRDVRTLVALGRSLGINTKSKQPFEGTVHNALDDAKHQVKYCCDTWQKIKAFQ